MTEGDVPVDARINIVSVCRQMKWTYHDYLIQPDWFIVILGIMNDLDYKKQKDAIPKKGTKK